MTEPNEQYAYFTISGEFDPAEISKRVCVTPTEAWVKGEINPRSHLERKCSRWSLHSRLEKSCELEAHIADVINQLDDRKSEFVEVSSQHGGQMQLVAYFKTDYPGLHLEQELVESLAKYGLSIDFDFYYLHSAYREDS